MDIALTFIYALCCPYTGDVRYIGKANNPEIRLEQHIKESVQKKNHRHFWIQSIYAKNDTPKIKILEVIKCEDWVSREKFWIKYYTENGSNLTNSTIGGEGTVGYIFTEEHKKNLSLANKRKPPPSEASRIKNSLSHKGKRNTPEVAALIGLKNRGKIRSKEAIEKVAEFHRGRKRSEETCLRISQALAGKKRKPFTQEHKDKIAQAHIGKSKGNRSEEVKLKNSVASKLMWSDPQRRVDHGLKIKAVWARKRKEQ